MADEVSEIGVAVLCLGLPFAVLGGIMVALIWYNEMQHHFPARRAILESVKMGIVASVFLVVLSLVAAAMLVYVLK